ncbi:hypothetical protein A0U96_03590 [Lactiplantibacillus plantarum]|nr:hypothetical protein A0U96_03590 [Lactiplantibacillus plantarum]
MATMIKFRAWDKATSSYRKVLEIEFYPDGELKKVKVAGLQRKGTITPDNLVLEQFTGLTDVNGKEIYEGDILRLSRDEPKTYIYDDEDNLKPKIIMPKTVTETAPVTKDIGTFGVSVKGVFLMLREVDKGQQNIEVIGNVHTNPELLEE